MNRKTKYYALSMPSSSTLSAFDCVVTSGVTHLVWYCLSIINKIGERRLMLIDPDYLFSLSIVGYGIFGQARSVFNLFGIIASMVAPATSTATRLFISEMLPNK